MRQFFLSFLVVMAGFSSIVFASPYQAAQSGDVAELRGYRFEGIDLFLPDERGFIPYELAALYADPSNQDSLRKNVEVMLWLKEYKPEMHKYGEASIKLVQAGLQDLGYDAGSVDGKLGNKTVDAIKQYQKDHELAETGTLAPHWLGAFHRDLLKSIQQKLTSLGYNTKGTDGLMGPNTESALRAYRKRKALPQIDYAKLDAELVTSVDKQFGINQQKVQAEKDKAARQIEESSTKYLQAGLLTLGYSVGKVDGQLGSRTEKALVSFQKKYKLSQTGKFDDKTRATFDTAVLKETQRKLNALGFNTGKPDGKMGKKTQRAITQFKQKNKSANGTGVSYQLVNTVDMEFDAIYNKRSKTAKKATTKKSTKQPTKSSTKATFNATKRPTTAKSNTNKTSTSSDIVKADNSNNSKTSSVSSKSAKGRMSFKRDSGRVVGCSISGRNIPIEWCEPFYPLPKNNHCEATFKSSGGVINLWCK